jgi:hypothetical protein
MATIVYQEHPPTSKIAGNYYNNFVILLLFLPMLSVLQSM